MSCCVCSNRRCRLRTLITQVLCFIRANVSVWGLLYGASMAALALPTAAWHRTRAVSKSQASSVARDLSSSWSASRHSRSQSSPVAGTLVCWYKQPVTPPACSPSGICVSCGDNEVFSSELLSICSCELPVYLPTFSSHIFLNMTHLHSLTCARAHMQTHTHLKPVCVCILFVNLKM